MRVDEIDKRPDDDQSNDDDGTSPNMRMSDQMSGITCWNVKMMKTKQDE
jgi:hypothetical protein